MKKFELTEALKTDVINLLGLATHSKFSFELVNNVINSVQNLPEIKEKINDTDTGTNTQC